MTGAQQRLTFGEHRDLGVIEEAMETSRSGSLKSNPCVIAFGPGPEGAVCGDCDRLYRRGGTAGSYLKCELRRETGGPRSDHRAGWPACSRYVGTRAERAAVRKLWEETHK